MIKMKTGLPKPSYHVDWNGKGKGQGKGKDQIIKTQSTVTSS